MQVLRLEEGGAGGCVFDRFQGILACVARSTTSFALPDYNSVSILTNDPHPAVRRSPRTLEADGISARHVSLAA